MLVSGEPERGGAVLVSGEPQREGAVRSIDLR